MGYEVLDWLHEFTCHGVGDVQGVPLDMDDEMRDHIVESYRIDPASGRRVYNESVLSRPKGRAKFEIAALVVAEAFGPVRFDGWNAEGQSVARSRISFTLCSNLSSQPDSFTVGLPGTKLTNLGIGSVGNTSSRGSSVMTLCPTSIPFSWKSSGGSSSYTMSAAGISRSSGPKSTPLPSRARATVKY